MKSFKVNKQFLSVFMLGTAIASGSFAQGSKGGGGGNAIVCFAQDAIVQTILSRPVDKRFISDTEVDQITFIKALDLFEAEHHANGIDDVGDRPGPIIQPFEKEKNSEYLERIAKRFEDSIPIVASEIRESMEAAGKSTSVYNRGEPTSGIAQIYDIGKTPYVINKKKNRLQSACLLMTIARQTGSPALGSFHLDIDGRLMNHRLNSNLSKKVLYLHEMIYAWGRDVNHKDSSATRALVSILIRPKVSREDVVMAIISNSFDRLIFDLPSNRPSYLYGEDLVANRFQHEMGEILKPVLQLMSPAKEFRDFDFDARKHVKLKEELQESLGVAKVALANILAAIARDEMHPRQNAEALVQLNEQKAKWSEVVSIDEKEIKDEEGKIQALSQNRAQAVTTLEAIEASMDGYERRIASQLNSLAGGTCYADSSEMKHLGNVIAAAPAALTGKVSDSSLPIASGESFNYYQVTSVFKDFVRNDLIHHCNDFIIP